MVPILSVSVRMMMLVEFGIQAMEEALHRFVSFERPVMMRAPRL
jgi:hypothetical protein